MKYDFKKFYDSIKDNEIVDKRDNKKIRKRKSKIYGINKSRRKK